MQGYDTGWWVAPELGKQDPDRVIGVHLNAMITFPVEVEGEMDGLTEVEQARWERMQNFNDGYLQWIIEPVAVAPHSGETTLFPNGWSASSATTARVAQTRQALAHWPANGWYGRPSQFSR